MTDASISCLNPHSAKETNFLCMHETESSTSEVSQSSTADDARNSNDCKRTKTENIAHVCDICTKTFLKKSSLKTHYHVHAGVKPFICEICYKTFSKKCTLEIHSLIHSGKRPFNCEICEKRFARKTDLQKHHLIHTGNRPYSCEFCTKSFNHKSNFRKHRITHTGIKPHVCDVCRQPFTHKNVLLNHLKNHYIEENIKQADRSNKEELTIRSYLKTMIKKNFHQCDTCDKLFLRSDQFKKHKLTHSSDWALNHICEVCNAKFKSKDTLQEHLLNHVVLTFKNDNLDDYRDVNTLTASVTAEMLQSSTSNKIIICDVCFKTFTRKSSLNDHYLIHLGKKPHKCSLCDKSFSQKVTLKRHLQVHSGERPFACKVCKKKFTRKSSLQKHYIIHSPKLI